MRRELVCSAILVIIALALVSGVQFDANTNYGTEL